MTASMEDVLGIYTEPYSKNYPVVSMNELAVQLRKERHQPIAVTLDQPQRVDYEGEPAGTA